MENNELNPVLSAFSKLYKSAKGYTYRPVIYKNSQHLLKAITALLPETRKFKLLPPKHKLQIYGVSALNLMSGSISKKILENLLGMKIGGDGGDDRLVNYFFIAYLHDFDAFRDKETSRVASRESVVKSIARAIACNQFEHMTFALQTDCGNYEISLRTHAFETAARFDSDEGVIRYRAELQDYGDSRALVSCIHPKAKVRQFKSMAQVRQTYSGGTRVARLQEDVLCLFQVGVPFDSSFRHVKVIVKKSDDGYTCYDLGHFGSSPLKYVKSSLSVEKMILDYLQSERIAADIKISRSNLIVNKDGKQEFEAYLTLRFKDVKKKNILVLADLLDKPIAVPVQLVCIEDMRIVPRGDYYSTFGNFFLIFSSPIGLFRTEVRMSPGLTMELDLLNKKAEQLSKEEAGLKKLLDIYLVGVNKVLKKIEHR